MRELEAGQIIVTISGISLDETNRLKEIIHTLISNEALNVRNGNVIMSFDNDKKLRQIQFDFVKWRKNK